MRILIVSHVYAPNIGGVEAVGEMLAHAFQDAGHDVTVVTQTPGPAGVPEPNVIRRPSSLTLAHAVRWAEVVLHNNISLRALWPLLLFRRPWVVAHHTWLARPDGNAAWQDRIKQSVARFATNVAPSRAVADALPVPCRVVGNPYRDDVFVEDANAQRSRDLVSVGRLVSDKGADLLIDALADLLRRSITPTLTIVGSGPEEQRLRAQVQAQGLSAQVEFAGTSTGRELARLLNAHRVLVVPSRWQEPFGIVALEGIACGCVVVGSSGGGLADAIGECGVTFENGNSASLAQALEKVLSDSALRLKCRAAAPEHLARHRRKDIAAAYLRVITAVTRN